MKLIGITTDTIFDNEAGLITRLLDCGIDRVHIRKPEYLSTDVEQLLQQIPSAYHPRLSLHDHFDLAVRYDIGGVHLNRRNPVAPKGYRGIISRSCHSFEEIALCRNIDYCFLSPIFDSISKRGYHSSFTSETLDAAREKGIITEKVFALGGVTPRHLPQLRTWGFGGAVMLGYLWEEQEPAKLQARIQEIVALCKQ